MSRQSLRFVARPFRARASPKKCPVTPFRFPPPPRPRRQAGGTWGGRNGGAKRGHRPLFSCCAEQPTPPAPALLAGQRGDPSERAAFKGSQMAIAANYRKHADGLIRQLELDFSGIDDASSRTAWWAWLMSAGKVQPLARPAVPAWAASLAKRAKALAKSVKAACMHLELVQSAPLPEIFACW